MPGFTFRRADAHRWHAIHGLAAHPHAPPDVYALAGIPCGNVYAPTALAAVGIYLIVDRFDELHYIGKVCRGTPTAVRDRLASHHAATTSWFAVWILPLHDRCPNQLVEVLESQLIRAYRPCGNVQHNRLRGMAS